RQPILVDLGRCRRIVCSEQGKPISSPLIDPLPKHVLHEVLLARGGHGSEIKAVTPPGRCSDLRFADQLVVSPSVDMDGCRSVQPSALIALGQVVLVLIGRHAGLNERALAPLARSTYTEFKIYARVGSWSLCVVEGLRATRFLFPIKGRRYRPCDRRVRS